MWQRFEKWFSFLGNTWTTKLRKKRQLPSFFKKVSKTKQSWLLWKLKTWRINFKNFQSGIHRIAALRLFFVLRLEEDMLWNLFVFLLRIVRAEQEEDFLEKMVQLKANAWRIWTWKNFFFGLERTIPRHVVLMKSNTFFTLDE